jgi:hypothetical protein
MLQLDELLFLSPSTAEQKREMLMVEQSMLRLPRELSATIKKGKKLKYFRTDESPIPDCSQKIWCEFW